MVRRSTGFKNTMREREAQVLEGLLSINDLPFFIIVNPSNVNLENLFRVLAYYVNCHVFVTPYGDRSNIFL